MDGNFYSLEAIRALDSETDISEQEEDVDGRGGSMTLTARSDNHRDERGKTSSVERSEEALRGRWERIWPVDNRGMSRETEGKPPLGIGTQAARETEDDDGLLYDNEEDEVNEEWVSSVLKGGRGGYDLMLACPGCFTTVCYEAKATEQRRGIFVGRVAVNCCFELPPSSRGKSKKDVRCEECNTHVGSVTKKSDAIFDHVLPSTN